jgi:hypothetical protein
MCEYIEIGRSFIFFVDNKFLYFGDLGHKVEEEAKFYFKEAFCDRPAWGNASNSQRWDMMKYILSSVKHELRLD